MNVPQPNLVFDVGLFDGDDTAWYLFRGYRVVAVDANPQMIAQAEKRFSAEISAGRLQLVNAGIGRATGSEEFWLSAVEEWSSFDRRIASRDGVAHEAITVPVIPFGELLDRHGTPHYLKIDIEGHDHLCVDALAGRPLPPFISVEAECVGDSDSLSDEEAISMLERLRHVGYKRFKLVNQVGLLPVRANPVGRLMNAVVVSAARGKLRLPGLSAIAERYTDEGRRAALGFPFSQGSTGPWGEEVPGAWMSYSRARELYLRRRHAFFASGNPPLHGFWYDWHAKAG